MSISEKAERNARVQARYDELMLREGKHGHYETMFRVVREEVERALSLHQDERLSALWIAETRENERLRAALDGLHSFVAVMIGRGTDAIIPEVCNSPLGIPIKIGDLMREAAALIADKDPT